jgi:hypothetical protein
VRIERKEGVASHILPGILDIFCFVFDLRRRQNSSAAVETENVEPIAL